MIYEYVVTLMIVNNELEKNVEEKGNILFKTPSRHLSRGTEEYFERSVRISILDRIRLQDFPGPRNVKPSTADFGGLSAGNEEIHQLLGYTDSGPSFETEPLY
jgi:hypothetical protein